MSTSVKDFEPETPQDYVFPSDYLNKFFPEAKTGEKVALVACGSFNPITTLHLRMFEEARDYLINEKGFDVIAGFISPVNDKYKKAGLLPSKHRVEMCKLACQSSSWIQTDCWEASQPEFTRTRLVLEHIKKHVQEKVGAGVHVLFLCGADVLESMTGTVWRKEDVQYIVENFGCISLEREANKLVNVVFQHDVLYNNRV